MDNNELLRVAPEISTEILLEEDKPKIGMAIPKARLEEIKTAREEARKDADSDHSRKRDTWVTIAGLILVCVLIILYMITVYQNQPNEYKTSFLHLLSSVVMLIIGYIFGKNINR